MHEATAMSPAAPHVFGYAKEINMGLGIPPGVPRPTRRQPRIAEKPDCMHDHCMASRCARSCQAHWKARPTRQTLVCMGFRHPIVREGSARRRQCPGRHLPHRVARSPAIPALSAPAARSARHVRVHSPLTNEARLLPTTFSSALTSRGRGPPGVSTKNRPRPSFACHLRTSSTALRRPPRSAGIRTARHRHPCIR